MLWRRVFSPQFIEQAHFCELRKKFCWLTWMGFSSLDVGSAAKIIFPEFAQVSQFAGYAGSAWNSFSTYDQRTVSTVFKTSVRFWRDIREPDQVLIRALQKKVPGIEKSLCLGKENYSWLMKWVKGSHLTNQTPPQTDRFNEHRRPILNPSGSYIQIVVSEYLLSNSHSISHNYLSHLKHLDMNAIVLGKHVRRTSFIKPKPSSLWECPRREEQ